MPAFVYVIATAGPGPFRTYVGWTTDLDRRLAAHNAGKGAKSTRGRTWVLIHSERCKSRRAAMSREWYLKRDRTFRKALADAFKSNRAIARPPRASRRRSARSSELRSPAARRASGRAAR
ncbi:MAG: GIY-YIG nuclease family protein [Alphaproteobacteria bacterium]|nr:GIY-YIG nuclease family protein [Alphaproteobacteria bacterium]